jgi:hypothetical protein
MEGKPPQVTEAVFLLGRLFNGGADCTKSLILLLSEESHSSDISYMSVWLRLIVVFYRWNMLVLDS